MGCARRSAPSVPLVVLAPLEPGEEAGAGGFEIVVSSLEDYARLRASGVACAVHVKADTGMGRWGLAPADALAVGRDLADGGQPLRLAALMSHLATADDDPAFAAEQTEVFADLERRFPPCARHLANSAAALVLPETRYDAVRCGIAVYGVSPFGDGPGEHGLLPALRWTSHVAGLRSSRPASPRAMAGPDRHRPRVAYVPVGYATATRGSRAGVPGAGARRATPVCRDHLDGSAHCIVDERVQLGDEVVLIGEQGDERITAEELAAHTETIAWETVCDASLAIRRGRRTYIRAMTRKPPSAVPVGTALGCLIRVRGVLAPQSDHSRSILEARMPPTFS